MTNHNTNNKFNADMSRETVAFMDALLGQAAASGLSLNTYMAALRTDLEGKNVEMAPATIRVNNIVGPLPEGFDNDSMTDAYEAFVESINGSGLTLEEAILRNRLSDAYSIYMGLMNDTSEGEDDVAATIGLAAPGDDDEVTEENLRADLNFYEKACVHLTGKLADDENGHTHEDGTHCEPAKL